MKIIRLFLRILAVPAVAVAVMGCQAPRLPWRKDASHGQVAQVSSSAPIGQQNLATTTGLGGTVSTSSPNAVPLDQSSAEAEALASTSAKIDSASSTDTSRNEWRDGDVESASRSRGSSSGCSSGCCSR